MFHIFYFTPRYKMSRYDKFIVYPGPEYEKHSIAIQRSDVTMGKHFYLINQFSDARFYVDNCRYVVKRKTRSGKAPLLKWRIDVDLKYIQLYWSKGLSRLENNKHVMIIRPKYRVIFRCIARLIQLKKRAQVRVKTRQSFRVSGMFKRHIFAPASMRVFAYI